MEGGLYTIFFAYFFIRMFFVFVTDVSALVCCTPVHYAYVTDRKKNIIMFSSNAKKLPGACESLI